VQLAGKSYVYNYSKKKRLTPSFGWETKSLSLEISEKACYGDRFMSHRADGSGGVPKVLMHDQAVEADG
jgi:hypothetical protein